MPNVKDRFDGVMLGLACGDALGYAVEFSAIEDIRRSFGPAGITELDEARVRGDVALFSDDTQMSLAVAHGLILAGHATTVDLAAAFVAAEFVEWSQAPVGGHRAPGGACMSGCRRLADGAPWEMAGHPDAGGCGSVMRSAPYALRFWKDHDLAVECSARHARMTHGHPLAGAASAALTSGVWHALHGATRDEICQSMIDAAARYDETTATMLLTDRDIGLMVRASPDDGLRALIAAKVLDERRGWAGHEAICAAMFCFLVGHNYKDTVVLGANSPGDSDSIACIAGALAGAFYGVQDIPARWAEVIERRDELLMTSGMLLAASGYGGIG